MKGDVKMVVIATMTMNKQLRVPKKYNFRILLRREVP